MQRQHGILARVCCSKGKQERSMLLFRVLTNFPHRHFNGNQLAYCGVLSLIGLSLRGLIVVN